MARVDVVADLRRMPGLHVTELAHEERNGLRLVLVEDPENSYRRGRRFVFFQKADGEPQMLSPEECHFLVRVAPLLAEHFLSPAPVGT